MTKRYLSLCAIIKDEAGYLPEWLEHHILQGVQHFYIYDNNSVDSTRTLLTTTYKDFVTYTHWLAEPGQLGAYVDCLNKYGKETEWLAFVDSDEFIYSLEPLRDALKQYEYASALAIHWRLFGSNGHKKKEQGLVVERFTKRAEEVNPHVKSIVRPEFTIYPLDPHAFKVEGTVVDERHLHLGPHYAVSPDGTAGKLAIYHYHTKSEEEARARWARPRADIGERRDFDTHFPAHDVNEVQDLTLAELAPLLKAAIEMRKK